MASIIAKALAHTGSGGAVSVTTSAINTTGANFLLLCSTFYTDLTSTPSDSKGNTWQSLTKYGTTNSFVRIFYCYNPSVGSDHTLTMTFGSSNYASLFAYSFDGMDITSGVFDAENGASAYATGTVTPAGSGELIVSAYNQFQYASAITEDPANGWTVEDSDPYLTGFTTGGSVALINPYASTNAIQCDWDLTQVTGNGEASAIAAFKLAAAGGKASLNTRAFPLGVRAGMGFGMGG